MDQAGGRGPRLNNLYLFNLMNTLSWSIVQGLPLVLFFKSMHASATVLGVVVGMTPFFQLLQIPAASWVERVGYRRFCVMGWTGRNLVLLALVAVAFLAPLVSVGLTIALACGVMLVYNALRGVGSAGFLPWFSQLFPPAIRGVILSREKLAIQVSLIFNMVAVAWFLGLFPDGYAWLFVYAWLTGGVAVLFLRRIPDVPVQAVAANATPVPWRQLIRHPPFARLLQGMFFYHLALGAASVLWVLVLRDRYGLTDRDIATLPILSASANAFTMIGLGRILDRSGSRPVLIVAITLIFLHLLAWAGLAGGVLPYGLAVVLFLQATAGCGMGAVTLAVDRLLMASVLPMGRSHFFAISATLGGLTLGLSPIVWGFAADLIGHWSWGPCNSHSLPYAAAALLAVVSGVLLTSVPEARVLGTAAFLGEVLRLPVRALARWRAGTNEPW